MSCSLDETSGIKKVGMRTCNMHLSPALKSGRFGAAVISQHVDMIGKLMYLNDQRLH